MHVVPGNGHVVRVNMEKFCQCVVLMLKPWVWMENSADFIFS